MSRLCGLHDRVHSAVGLRVAHVRLEGGAEDGELAVGLEAVEGLLGFQHARGGPAERHLGIALALDVAAGLPDGAERILDDVGAGQHSAVPSSSISS